MAAGGGLEPGQSRQVFGYAMYLKVLPRLTFAVAGDNDSEIMKLVRSISKEAGKA
jgi:hypothetical protein